MLLIILKVKKELSSVFQKTSKGLFGEKILFGTFANPFGLVAQLNRAPDYGSGGFRFES